MSINNPGDRSQRLEQMERAASAQRRGPGRLGICIGRGQGHAPPPRRMPAHEDKQRADEPIVYEVYGPGHPDVVSGRRRTPKGRPLGADDPLVQQLKRRINSAGISRKDINAAFVGTGPGALFQTENQAYNLVYGLRLRPTITLECARRWLAVLGEQLGTFIQPVEGGWHDRLVELRDAVARGGSPPEDLRVLADAAFPPDENDLLVMPPVEGFEEQAEDESPAPPPPGREG